MDNDRKDQIVDFISALDDNEFRALVNEARGPQTTDVKTLIQREMQQLGISPGLTDVGPLLRQELTRDQNGTQQQ